VEAGRRREAWLTDAGVAKLEEVAAGHAREVRRLVVDALPPELLAALGEAARAITAAVLDGAPEECRTPPSC
jgi:hypothetical protein